MICYWFPEPTYWFIADGVPDLLYYSHFPTMVLALLIGLFVFFNNPKKLANRLLLLISTLFSIWTITSLILWTWIDSQLLAFVWTIHVSMFSFIAVFSVYFMYTFLYDKDVSWKLKSIFALLLAPILLFGATDLNISGFDIGNCDAFMYEGQIFKGYYIALAILSMVWILALVTKSYQNIKQEMKKQVILMTIGIEFFLFTFFSLVILASYLTEFGFFQDSRLELYGLFGMTFFMGMLGVLIVRFKAFKGGIAAPIALVVALIFVTASQFTYVESRSGFGVTTVTLVLSTFVAYILIHSVRREIKQRQKLEELTQELASANERLKELDKLKSEFVSIASHQLRSPITAIRGYASLLLEGSYGTIPKKAEEALERIEKSSGLMAASIEDYLNVSRIESGNMKYNLSDFNLRDEVEHITDDLRSDATKSGLGLLFKTNLNSQGVIHADIGKTIQIVQNLINNSIKYTEKGSVTVLVRDDVKRKKIYVDIIDTGIGMSEKTIATIFEKFGRAENANSVNSSGTGLGLFVAKMMAEAMGGNISAHSEGDGKGSRFTLEMPLAM